MLSRRSFIAGLIAAPAVVRAESLMKIIRTDDAPWLQRYLDRHHTIPPGHYVLNSGLLLPKHALIKGCHFTGSADYALSIGRDGVSRIENCFFAMDQRKTRAAIKCGDGGFFSASWDGDLG